MHDNHFHVVFFPAGRVPPLGLRRHLSWAALMIIGLLATEPCLSATDVKKCEGPDSEEANAQFVARVSGGYLLYLPPGAPRNGLQPHLRPGAVFADFDGDGRCDAAFVTVVNTPVRVDDPTATLPFEFYATTETSLTSHRIGNAPRWDILRLAKYQFSLLLIVHCWDDDRAAKKLRHVRSVVLSQYTSPVVICAFPSRRKLPAAPAGDAPLDVPPPLAGDAIHFLDRYGIGNAIIWNPFRKEYRQYPIKDERCP